MIPPLVKSLRKHNQDPVAGTAELLLSFTAAFEHVPTHRRLQLFTSLIHTLGEDEFLFALLSMLADKYPGNENVDAFIVELTMQYGPITQLTVGSQLHIVILQGSTDRDRLPIRSSISRWMFWRPLGFYPKY